MDRYLRNHNAISETEQKQLAKAKVFVAGCGGLGGYVIELLARIGIGHITALDSDVFETSNLNRQILSTESTLGKPKAEVAKTHISEINSQIEFISHVVRITSENAPYYLAGHDIAIDALDNFPSRLALIQAARKTDIPLIHGAISGWWGRVSVIYPEDQALESILNVTDKSISSPYGNLGFTAACVASFEVAEVIKILLGRGNLSRNTLKEIDLFNGSCDDIPLINEQV